MSAAQVLLTILAAVYAPWSQAQQATAGEFARIAVLKPKAGQAAAFPERPAPHGQGLAVQVHCTRTDSAGPGSGSGSGGGGGSTRSTRNGLLPWTLTTSSGARPVTMYVCPAESAASSRCESASGAPANTLAAPDNNVSATPDAVLAGA